MFDVPGEYSQIAFTQFGTPYQLTETPFTFQGIGLGGNSQFNGMLFQTNPRRNLTIAGLPGGIGKTFGLTFGASAKIFQLPMYPQPTESRRILGRR